MGTIGTTPEEDEMLDRLEVNMCRRRLPFPMMHRLRWWAVKGVKFWFRERKPVKVEFD